MDPLVVHFAISRDISSSDFYTLIKHIDDAEITTTGLRIGSKSLFFFFGQFKTLAPIFEGGDAIIRYTEPLESRQNVLQIHAFGYDSLDDFPIQPFVDILGLAYNPIASERRDICSTDSKKDARLFLHFDTASFVDKYGIMVDDVLTFKCWKCETNRRPHFFEPPKLPFHTHLENILDMYARKRLKWCVFCDRQNSFHRIP